MKTSLLLLSLTSLTAGLAGCITDESADGAATTPGTSASATAATAGSTPAKAIVPSAITHAPEPSRVLSCIVDPVACMASGTRLLVVGPASFASEMSRLVDHKNATGMPAAYVTTAQLAGYPGVDDAARLKNVIRLAHETRGVEYVLLAGDAAVVPVRRRLVFDLVANNYGFIPADLYYSNLYHHAGPNAGSFDSWDSNGDGIYDEEFWSDDAYSNNPDGVDGYPDVAVGRVPAATTAELARFVDKDIHYETILNPTMSLSRAAFVADANYDGADALINQIVGETYLSSTGSPTLYGANYDAAKPLPAGYAAADFATLDGLLFTMPWVGFVGHGNPQVWDVIQSDAYYDAGHVATLKNDNHPIVIAAACETAQFAPIVQTWDGHVYDDAGQTSIGGEFVIGSGAEGGAIAYFGEMVVLPNYMAVEIETAMLNTYGSGARTLGALWLGGARLYWQRHLKDEKVFENPRIYLSIMTLLGDPSLRLE